jgi:hypothetical protein
LFPFDEDLPGVFSRELSVQELVVLLDFVASKIGTAGKLRLRNVKSGVKLGSYQAHFSRQQKSDSLHTEFSGRIYNKRINLTESLVTPFA